MRKELSLILPVVATLSVLALNSVMGSAVSMMISVLKVSSYYRNNKSLSFKGFEVSRNVRGI